VSAATDLDWRQRSACKDEDPEIFFRDSQRGVRQAKAVCTRCPVTATCLAWALSAPDDRFGVAGGLTAGERNDLRRAAEVAA